MEMQLVEPILPPSRILVTAHHHALSQASEDAFFTVLHQSNGTTRMTSSNRLDDLNAAFLACRHGHHNLRALDVGISSGISTLEWIESIESTGIRCEMTACDRVLDAQLLQFGSLEVLSEKSGFVLMVHTGRRAFIRPLHVVPDWRNGIARLSFTVADHFSRAMARTGRLNSVKLVSPRLQKKRTVKICEHDVFQGCPEWIGQFDVVRVANLLNFSYFSKEQISIGLANVGTWVAEGGLLLIARTSPTGVNDASIFRREHFGFSLVRDLGAGSEIRQLVLEVTV